MIRHLRKEDGRALAVIVWIVAIFIVIVGAAIGLTAMGAIRYPPDAVNWSGVGPLLVRLNAQFYTFEEQVDPTLDEPDEPSYAHQIAGLADDDAARLLRDLSFKTSRIDDLEGQLESKNDQIAKLEERIQLLRTQLDDYKPENRKALIKIYDRMESRAAVEILSNLTPERAVVILSSMKDSRAAEILSAMDPDIALRITELMAGFSATELMAQRDVARPGRTTPPRQPTRPAVQPTEEEPVGPPFVVEDTPQAGETPEEEESDESEDEDTDPETAG